MQYVLKTGNRKFLEQDGLMPQFLITWVMNPSENLRRILYSIPRKKVFSLQHSNNDMLIYS